MICLNTITNFLSGGKNRTVGVTYFFYTNNNFSRSCKKMVLNLNLCSLIFPPFVRTNLFNDIKFFIQHQKRAEFINFFLHMW